MCLKWWICINCPWGKHTHVNDHDWKISFRRPNVRLTPHFSPLWRWNRLEKQYGRDINLQEIDFFPINIFVSDYTTPFLHFWFPWWYRRRQESKPGAETRLIASLCLLLHQCLNSSSEFSIWNLKLQNKMKSKCHYYTKVATRMDCTMKIVTVIHC